MICLDRGYRQHAAIDICHTFDLTPIIEARNDEATRLAHNPTHHANRWIVERTFSWLNRYRRLLIRWEKKSQNYSHSSTSPAPSSPSATSPYQG